MNTAAARRIALATLVARVEMMDVRPVIWESPAAPLAADR
jgi:hypothetical protein